MPPFDPTLDPIIPIIGGMTAPPTTAMINRPEISLALCGQLFIAIEKTRGNKFPAPIPIIKMDTKAMVAEVENKRSKTPSIANIVVEIKNGRASKN